MKDKINEQTEEVRMFGTYRRHTSCTHIGKYIPSTKRKVSWYFGFSNILALSRGYVGNDCKGEEHEVHLIWSVRSGKASVFWNNTDITSQISVDSILFGNCSLGLSALSPKVIIQFEWQTHSHHNFKLVAHSFITPGYIQYDLIIDEKSFSTLPYPSELGTKSFLFAARRGYNFHKGMKKISIPTQKRDPIGKKIATDVLSLDTSNSTRDDLSFVYNTSSSDRELPIAYDTLRMDITTSVPATKTMFPQAIISAFLSNRHLISSGNHHPIVYDYSTPCEPIDAIQIEADVLWESIEWINNQTFSTGFHINKDEFIQQQMNKIILFVRRKILTASEASQTIHAISALLGLELDKPLPRNTVMLMGLRQNVTQSDVQNALIPYGQIEKVGIASGGHGFGICRFFSTSAVKRVTIAAIRRELLVQDVFPQIIELPSSAYDTSPRFSANKYRKGAYPQALTQIQPLLQIKPPLQKDVSYWSLATADSSKAESESNRLPHLMKEDSDVNLTFLNGWRPTKSNTHTLET